MNSTASSLRIDLYQLAMLQTYHAHGMEEAAVYDLFVRQLPENRNFLVAAGLEQALQWQSRRSTRPPSPLNGSSTKCDYPGGPWFDY